MLPLYKQHSSSSSTSQDLRFSGGQSQGSSNQPLFQHKVPKFLGNDRTSKLNINQSAEELNGEQICSVIVMTQKKQLGTTSLGEQEFSDPYQSMSKMNKLIPTQQILLQTGKKASSNSKGKKVSKNKRHFTDQKLVSAKSSGYNSAIKIIDKNINVQIIDQERTRQLKSSQNLTLRSAQKQSMLNEKLKSAEKLKLSPKIDQKFRRYHEGKSSQSKIKSHKERLISEKRKKISENAQKPNVLQISLQNDKEKQGQVYRKRVDSKDSTDMSSYLFKAARLQQSCEDLRRVNPMNQSPRKTNEDTQAIEIHLIQEKPKKKQFKSFVDSYISEARKGSDDESKNNISRDSSFSTELNTSTKVLKSKVGNQANAVLQGPNGAIKSHLHLFQQRRTSLNKLQLQQVKKPGQQSQNGENDRSISRLREADYFSQNDKNEGAGEPKLEDIGSPTQMGIASRNLDETSGRHLSAQQPLQTLVKTKFQYFNHQKKISSPPPQTRALGRLPLEIDIPKLNQENGTIRNMNGNLGIQSKTAKNSNVRKLNSDHPSKRTSRKIQDSKRKPEQAVTFQFPSSSSQNSPIDTGKHQIESPLDSKRRPQQFEAHENSYFQEEQVVLNVISARVPQEEEISMDPPNLRHIKTKSMHTSGYHYIQRQESIRILNYVKRGCQCFKFNHKDQFCCVNAQNWITLAYKTEYKHDSYQKTYESIYFTSQYQTIDQEQSIRDDIERTFSSTLYFMDLEVRESLLRLLKAYASYEKEVGYVQGMSFIAAALFYHAGEVVTFWLLVALMDQYSLKDVFKYNLPGVTMHEDAIQKLGQIYLEDLFNHLVLQMFGIIFCRINWKLSCNTLQQNGL